MDHTWWIYLPGASLGMRYQEPRATTDATARVIASLICTNLLYWSNPDAFRLDQCLSRPRLFTARIRAVWTFESTLASTELASSSFMSAHNMDDPIAVGAENIYNYPA